MNNDLDEILAKTFNLQGKLKRFRAGESIEIADCAEDEIMALFKSVFGRHILGWKEKTRKEARIEQLLELKRLSTQPQNENKCKLFSN